MVSGWSASSNPVWQLHARMDPLGFALENFDGSAVACRTPDADRRSVCFPTAPGSTSVRLLQVLLEPSRRIRDDRRRKLMTYALGEGRILMRPRFDDRAEAAQPHHLSSLIIGIVEAAVPDEESPEP